MKTAQPILSRHITTGPMVGRHKKNATEETPAALSLVNSLVQG